MAFLDNLSGILSEKGKEAAEVAKKVAEIANLRNMNVEELERITEQNSIELFGLEV